MKRALPGVIKDVDSFLILSTPHLRKKIVENYGIYSCKRCRAPVEITHPRRSWAMQFMLVPHLHVVGDLIGDLRYRVICEDCGKGLQKTIEAFMVALGHPSPGGKDAKEA